MSDEDIGGLLLVEAFERTAQGKSSIVRAISVPPTQFSVIKELVIMFVTVFVSTLPNADQGSVNPEEHEIKQNDRSQSQCKNSDQQSVNLSTHGIALREQGIQTAGFVLSDNRNPRQICIKILDWMFQRTFGKSYSARKPFNRKKDGVSDCGVACYGLYFCLGRDRLQHGKITLVGCPFRLWFR